MTTLREQLAEDFAVFLDTDELAETVTFYPTDGGASRSIVVCGVVTRSFEEDERGQLLVERFEFDVKRDATTGIATPQIGDSIKRATGQFSDVRFMFSGEIDSETDYSLGLVYDRKIPYRHGSEHTA